MKKISVIVLLLVSVLAFGQNKETRNVGAFTKLSFRLPGKLILKQGSTNSVVLEGDKELLSKIETEVEGGKLNIGREDKWRWSDWSWKDDNKITAYVTMSTIEYLGVGGSGDLIAEGKITANDLDLKVSGSGSLQIEVDAKGNLDVLMFLAVAIWM
jgi:hypothetical protein